MTDNLKIWDALAKTDPAHTKGFNRAGGFKGTAIKPIWIVKRLTEQFGPCGTGWGVDKPDFQVVPCGDEVLVYCTVRCWYDDGDELGNRGLHGVGGDKVVTKRNDGKLFHDDEAFKKAFTDAVGNAFKFIGVGADVHMGLFDDDKYVSKAREEFKSTSETSALQSMLDGIAACETQIQIRQWWEANSAKIPDADYNRVLEAVNNRTSAVKLMDQAA